MRHLSKIFRAKKNAIEGAFRLAGAQGFEPWKPFSLPVFKTGAIDHSAKPPNGAHDSTNNCNN